MATAAHLFALLLAASADLLATPPPLPTVTCGAEGAAGAAALAVRHVNEHHKHGFKFGLWKVLSSNFQQVPGGCHIGVHVKLVQTKCHFTDPKPLERCQPFGRAERGAVAACVAYVWVAWGSATVAGYDCATRPEPRDEELTRTCPDCPTLLALDDPTAVQAAQQAALKFNREGAHHKYFALMEVAHATSAYVRGTGPQTWIRLALVETNCPREARNPLAVCRPLCLQRAVSRCKVRTPPLFFFFAFQYVRGTGPQTWIRLALVETNCPREARNPLAVCRPLCLQRARHAYCKVTYYNMQKEVQDMECEIYPPKNSAPPPAGVEEPACGPLFHESPEAKACEARLAVRERAVHHICPFPLVVVLQRERYPQEREPWCSEDCE
ncbi:alpha-2-HS-glycoprotein-like [Syngnathoides biaculeatus]|uniref:alpha-2-HS-glycoprotein-like n=1 Tax=Syngnathoides biaculeatus TaxID=300417 RepID=UPI002ADD761F|nr:alpha-2-HS-glycoprotein-like [Syngnathoides biaculeatus]